MKKFLWIASLVGILGLSVGCHSGIMKGAGSDVSRLGDHMQN